MSQSLMNLSFQNGQWTTTAECRNEGSETDQFILTIRDLSIAMEAKTNTRPVIQKKPMSPSGLPVFLFPMLIYLVITTNATYSQPVPQLKYRTIHCPEFSIELPDTWQVFVGSSIEKLFDGKNMGSLESDNAIRLGFDITEVKQMELVAIDVSRNSRSFFYNNLNIRKTTKTDTSIDPAVLLGMLQDGFNSMGISTTDKQILILPNGQKCILLEAETILNMADRSSFIAKLYLYCYLGDYAIWIFTFACELNESQIMATAFEYMILSFLER